MGNNRNWIGWAALLLGGLALVVALGGRFAEMRGRMAYVYAVGPEAAQVMPGAGSMAGERFERGRFGPSAFVDGHAYQHGPMMVERFDGPRHGFGPLAMLFKLIGGLTKLAALGMLAWLLFRLFQQRQQAQVAAPTTPAGHDPRVE